jgi:ABC-2 type transport system permease protein
MDLVSAPRPAPAGSGGSVPGRPTDRDGSDRVRVITPQVRILPRLGDIWRYRELLLSLVRKELTVKYNSSFLGMLWSMLNPAFTLGIYYFVFQIVLHSGIQDFAIFLMSGLLAYNLFSYSLMNATGTMVGNAGIVKKVAFPREILPLASVGAGMVFFFFQGLVLLLVLIGARYVPGLAFLPLLIPAFVALIVLAAALSVLLSAVNVYLRDTQHFVELIVGAAWFWATPIVYSYSTISKELARHHLPSWLPCINPLTDVVLVFQRAIYAKPDGGLPGSPAAGASPSRSLQKGAQLLPHAGEWWYLWHVLVVLGAAAVLLVGALAVFARLEGNFAEEL